MMTRLFLFALCFFGLLAFSNAIQHPFVHDDVVFILYNPHISDLNHWYEAFWIPAVSEGINTYYRPVLEIIYRAEYYFFGPHPIGFHLFNILVHIANGFLLFALLEKLRLSRKVSWFVALLFLIHPVQTEAVSCIAGISNLWMALGILAALNAYLNKWYLMSGLFFVIAFLSKEQAVMFIPLVFVMDWYRSKKNYREWFFFTVITFALLCLRQWVTGASLAKDIMVSPGELYLRLAAVPRDLGMYLRLIFCPYDLHYYRSTDILQSNTVAWALALISLAAVVFCFKRYPQARSMMILGIGWFLAALFPVLNISPLINEYSFILTAEHFLYLPIAGVLILVVCAADYFLKGFNKILAVMVVLACLLLTWHQNTFWRGEIPLFERMLCFEPNFGRGHLLLAKAYYFNGRFQEADKQYSIAYAIISTYNRKASNLTAKKFYLDFLKEILFDWAQNDSALGLWKKALDKYKQAVVIDPHDASLYNNMAFVYVHLNDQKNAQLSLKKALQINPAFEQRPAKIGQI